MKHRIKSGAIITDNNKILLVKHVNPKTKFEYWVPPGGGVENIDKSIIETAKRETFEETGLIIELENNPKFIREYEDIERHVLSIEIFFKAISWDGEISIKNLRDGDEDKEYIQEARWLSFADMDEINVYPVELKEKYREEMKLKYLGRFTGSE